MLRVTSVNLLLSVAIFTSNKHKHRRRWSEKRHFYDGGRIRRRHGFRLRNVVRTQLGDFATNGMERVEVDEAKYGEVERMFRDGMGGALSQDVNVVALHKPSYSTLAGHARLEAFRLSLL
ncbi:hypothetical protein SASPL_110671 [Salvia splendens]|uniref:Uncharacterized protein n=1 Tax=Salvia splendens TaxID=180675 RepID=A0A8X9A2Y0_SALSN|nr:hypothetical protein SASPL_110671 [Salvia splendens]